ncbi:MAG TPA: hypothetical protein VHW09_27110 [Bryobacteraceae bacterium]|jgi:hypothetical protein|nr:hypothetical protein [Bryobacteraceae bacterium]
MTESSDKRRNVMDAIKDLNDAGFARKKKARYFLPAAEMAIIALHPVLEMVGGRIALMLEVALEAGEKTVEWQGMENAPDYAIFWVEPDLDNRNNDASGIPAHMILNYRKMIPAILKPVKWYPAPLPPMTKLEDTPSQ